MGQLFPVRLLPPAAGLGPGVAVFELFGALFFGAVGKIEALPALAPLPGLLRAPGLADTMAARQAEGAPSG